MREKSLTVSELCINSLAFPATSCYIAIEEGLFDVVFLLAVTVLQTVAVFFCLIAVLDW